ncbi:nuclear condensing complex subunit [Rhodofomes roseus]|uniref:Nuclear condensing complex subunit n=1 Tax=Rhodofomes roseus TaxID=34475 RepID=A0ABQ8KEX1_9APHY|nr:nuclear condensing complex subunit [Rhodofomes roseus]KAH9836048.1 nuclear condensing complex subunit [Rhodofomes roseus]
MPRNSLDLRSLYEVVPPIFDQSQLSTANHRKNCTTLHKLHLQAASVRQSVQNGNVTKLSGEKVFYDVFVDMTSRVLPIKKGCQVADRVVKFIGSYVQFILQKGDNPVRNVTHLWRYATAQTQQNKQGNDATVDDTLAARFALRLLKWLLQGSTAKDKTVRLRSVSLVTEIISHLGEIDEDTYSNLRECLVERAYDKEATIRVYAVIGLSKILGGEVPSELPANQPSMLEILLERLQYDDSAEVRRCALMHVPLTPRTVPAVLTRSRDVDPVVRKLLFATILSMGGSKSKSRLRKYQSSSNFEHPRQLTLAQREKVVRDGLGDREGAVRVAASQAIAIWFDILSGHEETDSDSSLGSVVAFVKLFDVITQEGIDVAVDALKSLFLTRILDNIVFDDAFWRNLSAESIFVARVFTTYCREHDMEAHLEAAKVPVVTALAFYLQEACNKLLDAIEELEDARLQADSRSEADAANDEEMERLEDVVSERAFVVSELLRMAALSDFSDEIGRRKAFAVVREMLAHELLPESLTEPCMDVLKASSPSERELIRVIVEMIAKLRDGEELFDAVSDQSNILPDGNSSLNTTQSSQRSRSLRRAKSYVDMSAEEQERADTIDLRCLGLCTAMLSRVQGSFDENSTLEGLLSDLVIPAVKRKELVLRERGLVNLGLCCLIAKSMAMNSFQLFLNQVQSAADDLKTKVLQVIFDILMVYDEELLLRSEDIASKIVTFLLQTLEVEESSAVQAVLCLGISKLMLAGLVTDPRVLTSMLMAYVSPTTADNQELRQCLSYFLPVYCYSSAANQRRMQSVALAASDLVRQAYGELADEEEMISPSQFGLLLVDWTDPRKLVNADKQGSSANDVHLDLAADILKALYVKDRTDEERKDLCQLLGKLYIPDKPGDLTLLLLHMLLSDLEDHCPFEDPAAEKMVDKFRSGFVKKFSRRIEGMDARTYADDERFRELCALIGLEFEEEGANEEQRGDVAAIEGEDEEEEEGEEEPEIQDVPTRQDKGKGREQAQVAAEPSDSEE